MRPQTSALRAFALLGTGTVLHACECTQGEQAFVCKQYACAAGTPLIGRPAPLPPCKMACMRTYTAAAAPNRVRVHKIPPCIVTLCPEGGPGSLVSLLHLRNTRERKSATFPSVRREGAASNARNGDGRVCRVRITLSQVTGQCTQCKSIHFLKALSASNTMVQE